MPFVLFVNTENLTLWQTWEAKYPRQDCTTPENETALNNILIVNTIKPQRYIHPITGHHTVQQKKKKCHNTAVRV